MTPPRLFLHLSARLRRLVVGMLLVALPLYGLGGALLQVLGPDHRHESAAGPSDFTPWSERVSRQLQALVDPQTARLIQSLRLQARLQPASSATHAHGPGTHAHHGVFERHHHAPTDASVLSTGARAGGQAAADAATAGSMVLPLALATALAIPLPPVQAIRWPTRAASPWRSHVPGLPERPPHA